MSCVWQPLAPGSVLASKRRIAAEAAYETVVQSALYP
jgi:hypothetical protein